jgi:hypothetical protein
MDNNQEVKTETTHGALIESQATENPGSTSPDNMDLQNGEWKASTKTKLAFSSICILALMAALDGTSIGVALPVSRIGFCDVATY